MGSSCGKYVKESVIVPIEYKYHVPKEHTERNITFTDPTIVILYAPPSYSLCALAEELSSYTNLPLLPANISDPSQHFKKVKYQNGFITSLYPRRFNEVHQLIASFPDFTIIPIFIMNTSIMDVHHYSASEIFGVDTTNSQISSLFSYLNEESMLKACYTELRKQNKFWIYYREIDFDFDVSSKILKLLSDVSLNKFCDENRRSTSSTSQ